jgi:hypothetical protein
MSRRLRPVPNPWRAVPAMAIAGCLVLSGGLAACGSPGATGTPAPTSTPTSTPTPTPAAPAPTPTRATSPSPGALPPATVAVDIPEAGVRLPVPAGWTQVPAADLTDPAKRAELAAAYPGAAALLEQADRLGSQAEPVFLAVDPTAAERGDPIAANLAVMVAQPAVGHPLLDFAAGFIADGMAESLGATGEASRAPEDLPAGDGVRIRLDLPPRDGIPMVATAWVVGAPGGTMLVTLLGPERALDGLDPDALAAAIAPLEGR